MGAAETMKYFFCSLPSIRLNLFLSYFTAFVFDLNLDLKIPLSIKSLYETIPYSVNNVLIPSLTAETCSFENNSVTRRDSPNLVTHEQYVYFYKIELFDENDITNFRMYGSPINNFQYSGATPQNGWGAIFELALEYSGGTITYQNPYYCI